MDMEVDDDPTKPITVEQYNKLMSLLNAQKMTENAGETSKSRAMMAGNFCLLSSHNSKWLLDSGATDHICSELIHFFNYKPAVCADNYITIPDGSRITVKHTGTVKLNDGIVLHNVLHVLDFKFNLISVHKLCKHLKCELHFTHDKCFVHTQRGQSIPLGSLRAGLYNVQEKKENNEVRPTHLCNNKLCLAVVEDAKLWHLRMGHLPFSQLKLVNPSCEIKSCLENTNSQVCPKAKQTRLPFPRSSIKTEKPFDLVHIDILSRPLQVVIGFSP